MGGGIVVDIDAKRHSRHDAPTLNRLERITQGSATAQLLTALEANEPSDVVSLARRANLLESEALELAQQALDEGLIVSLGQSLSTVTPLYTLAGWEHLSGMAQQVLAAYHEQNPLRVGMTREELRSRLSLTGALANLALNHLAKSGVLLDDAGTLHLPDHQVSVSEVQQAEMDAFVVKITLDPFPEKQPAITQQLLGLLLEQSKVVRVAEGVVFDSETYTVFERKIVNFLRANGKVTVAETRDMLRTSRKYALALLEHLAAVKITRRLGDERVLLNA